MICLHDKLIDEYMFKFEYLDYLPSSEICIYNSEIQDFCDCFGNMIDLSNTIILPISGINQVSEIRDCAIKKNIKVKIDCKDDEIISRWPYYYKTNRLVKIYSGKKLCKVDTIKEVIELFGCSFFFKTLKKNYSAVCSSDYLVNEESVLRKALLEHKDDLFILSDEVSIISDELGPCEYRCVVVDGVLRNVSRITEDIVHPIGSSVINKCNEVIDSLDDTSFPKSFVVDLMEYEVNGKREIDVIEFNSICSSGMYLYNSIVDLSTSNLDHSDIWRVPKNKEYVNTKVDGFINMGASKNFNCFGSFAESVKALSGEAIGVYIHSYRSGKRRYECDECLGDRAGRVNLFDMFGEITEICGEDDLKRTLSL